MPLHATSSPEKQESDERKYSLKNRMALCDLAMRDRELSPLAKNVLFALARSLNAKTGACHPHQGTLANLTGTGSDSSVRRVLRKLESASWITSERGRFGTHYKLALDRVATVRPEAAEPTATGNVVPFRAKTTTATGNDESEERSEPTPQPAQPPSPPAPVLAFEAGVMRLTEERLAEWLAIFPDINLRAELLGLTKIAGQMRSRNEDWRTAIPAILAKRNREARERNERIRIEAEAKARAPEKPFRKSLI